jgi:membrane fusion protein
MIAPEKRNVVVRLDLLAEFTARLSVGQKVNLRYAAFPYQKHGIQTGHITSISGGPVQADANGRERPSTRGSYRVLVKPDVQTIRQDGHDFPIPVGTPVEANVELSNERIIDWVYGILIKR